MRLVAGAVLILRAGSTLSGAPPPRGTIAAALQAGSGILLIPGLWTPIAGILVALTEISQVVTKDADPLVCLLVGTIGAALAMLGPGLWSVDARLFGWRRVEVPPRKTTTR
jgi:uncharacterized membrane protein YphA (DoxX/SURF4 family)